MTVVSKLGNRVSELYGIAFSSLEQLFAETSGATAIEYGLIAALIAVAAVGVMGTVGTNLSSTFNSVASAL
jgi:pilus assembly protein Flp/PilA